MPKRELLVLLPPMTRIQGDWCVVEIPFSYETRYPEVQEKSLNLKFAGQGQREPRELEPRELEPRELEPRELPDGRTR